MPGYSASYLIALRTQPGIRNCRQRGANRFNQNTKAIQQASFENIAANHQVSNYTVLMPQINPTLKAVFT
jgi:hypothetical protein